MGSTRILAGKKMNWLSRGTITVTDENPLFPKANLGNGWPSQPFKFATWGDKVIQIDTALGINGDFANWSGGAPVGWTVFTTGSATVVETSVAGEVISGKAAKLINPDGPGSQCAIQYDYLVRSGELLHFQCPTRGDGSAGMATIYLTNVDTGLYFNDSTKTWVAGPYSIGSGSSSTSYTSFNSVLTVQSITETLSSLTTIRVVILNTTVGTCYVDNVQTYTDQINMLSIHGHNIPPQVTVVLKSSILGSSWVTRGTMILGHPSCYLIVEGDPTKATHRYWRVTFTTTNTNPPTPPPISIGELLLGRVFEPLTQGLHQELLPFEWSESVPQIINESVAGVRWAYPRADEAVRELTMSFRDVSKEALEEYRTRIFKKSEYGSENILVIPDDEYPEVILGSIDSLSSWKHFLRNASDRELHIKELAFPVIVS